MFRLFLVAVACLLATIRPAAAGTTDLAVLRTKLQRVATPQDTILVALNGTQIVPPNGSTAAGTARLILNTVSNTLHFDITHNVSGETAAHIHGFASPGQNAPVVFTLPLGAVKLGTWNFSEAQEPFIREELAYIDVHSVAFAGGEIRGQIETCVNKPAVQNFQACLHVIVRNLGPDPYDGVTVFNKISGSLRPAAVAGKLKISIDIDEPTDTNKPRRSHLAALTLADSFPVDIAPGDSVDLDFGPVDYFPPRAGTHEVTSRSTPSGSNVDPNPANDQLLSFLVVLPSMPAVGPVALCTFVISAGVILSLRRRRSGGRRRTSSHQS